MNSNNYLLYHYKSKRITFDGGVKTQISCVLALLSIPGPPSLLAISTKRGDIKFDSDARLLDKRTPANLQQGTDGFHKMGLPEGNYFQVPGKQPNTH